MYLDRNGPLWCCPSGHKSPYATLESAEGTRQGCVLGQAFFAIGYAPFLRWLETRCTQGPHQGVPLLPYGFADDTHIVGSPYTLASILADGEPVLAHLTGLRLNRTKIKTLPPRLDPGSHRQ